MIFNNLKKTLALLLFFLFRTLIQSLVILFNVSFNTYNFDFFTLVRVKDQKLKKLFYCT